MKSLSQTSTCNNRLCGGFSLIEVLVATSISVVILGIIAMVASQTSGIAKRTDQGTISLTEAHQALKYIEEDLIAIVSPTRQMSTLCVVPENIRGENGLKTDSKWIMMTSRSAFSSKSGGARGISYRVAYIDPLQKNGIKKTMCLVRTSISSKDTAKSLMNALDPHEAFWDKNWIAQLEEDGKRQAIKDYLVGNVVEFNIELYCENPSGEIMLFPITVKTLWTHSGIENKEEASSQSSEKKHFSLKKVVLRLTTLNRQGVIALAAGRLTSQQVINQFGTTVTKEMQIQTVLLE